MKKDRVPAKNLLRFSVNRRGVSKIVVALVLTLIILIAFFAAWLFGLLPQQAKTSLSIEERLTKSVEDYPFKNPLVPVYFHYLDRYFNGLSQDAFDQAVAGVMNKASEQTKTAMLDLLASYKSHADILAPIIPPAFNLELSETVNPDAFSTALQESSLSMQSGATAERPGLYRPLSEAERANEFTPVVWIRSVNENLTDPMKIRPGETVKLEGYNFYDTDDLEVRIQSEAGEYHTVLSGSEVFVIGDSATPLSASRYDVRDKAYFNLPADIPPGYYSIIVTVPDSSSKQLIPSRFSSLPRQILVSSPNNQKYKVLAKTIYCEDETNPESALFWNLQDETLFNYIAITGDQRWSTVTYTRSFDDGTVYTYPYTLSLSESQVFGTDDEPYIEVNSELGIVTTGWEVDTLDGSTYGTIACGSTILAGIALVGEQLLAADAVLAIGAGIMFIASLFESSVTVAADIILWTEDDLYFLTENTSPRPEEFTVQYIEKQRHPIISTDSDLKINDYQLSGVSYSLPASGIEVQIPISGDYKFAIVPEYGTRSFSMWRGYLNNDEPSRYFVQFEVQRQG